jgi:hypothetical protein
LELFISKKICSLKTAYERRKKKTISIVKIEKRVT